MKLNPLHIAPSFYPMLDRPITTVLVVQIIIGLF